jgi:predicted Fe-Mo cluster-binding NifX family protein
MKLAVTTQRPDLDSPVDPQFGRARHILVIDTETNHVHVLDNQRNLNALQGAGIQAAQSIVEAGVSSLLTGQVGPKALAALEAAQIVVHTGVAGTAREALEVWRCGGWQSGGVEDRPVPSR